MFQSIATMVLERWYVFVFLIVFLFIATTHWGFTRTLKLLLLGYFIAWISEASSIRTGFPYGIYHYHYENLVGEPLVWGVPFWDSLSYVFLCFAGYMLALFLRGRWDRHTPLTTLQASWKTVLWGAFWTMVLDIIIDPVAHLGSLWFLGDIYHYPEGGLYFQVPLSNFAGWFLVALAILSAFRISDPLRGVPKNPKTIYLGVAFYWGIFLFNWGITLYVKAWWLALASAGWGLLILMLSKKRKSGLQDLV